MNGTVKPRKMSFPGQYRLGAEHIHATVYSIYKIVTTTSVLITSK